MGDSEDPGSQGAALVESTKTSPQLKVDFLAEVAALLFIRFIATKEPGQGSPKLADCLFVQLVRRWSWPCSFGSTRPTLQGSRTQLGFLTPSLVILSFGL